MERLIKNIEDRDLVVPSILDTIDGYINVSDREKLEDIEDEVIAYLNKLSLTPEDAIIFRKYFYFQYEAYVKYGRSLVITGLTYIAIYSDSIDLNNYPEIVNIVNKFKSDREFIEYSDGMTLEMLRDLTNDTDLEDALESTVEIVETVLREYLSETD